MKKVLSFLLIASMILTVSLTGCKKKETAESIYRDAVNDIKDAEAIGYTLDIGFSEGASYKIDVKKNGEDKEIVFDNNGRSGLTLYSDGTTHYYDLGEGERFSVKKSDDSVLMQELIDLDIFAPEGALFDKETFKDIAIDTADGEKKIYFTVAGDKLKSAYAPDEDLTFVIGAVTVIFTAEGDMKSLSLVADISEGTEFYGLPIKGGCRMSLEYKVNGVGDVSVGKADTNEEWPESPARALINPSVLVFANEFEAECDMEIIVGMMGITFTIPMEMYMAGKVADGKELSMVKMKMEAEIMGESINENETVFTDGNGDFEYHVTKDGNYKVAINKEEDNASDFLFSFDNVELYKNATVTKAGQNTVITITLTEDIMDKLFGAMNGMTDGEEGVGGMVGSGDDMRYETSTLEIVVGSDGNIVSGRSEIKMSQTMDMEDSMMGQTVEMTMTVKLDVSFTKPSEKINIEFPEGYKDYPLSNEN